MQKATNNNSNKKFIAPTHAILWLLLSIMCSNISAQDCPPNIDFEKGSFDGWTCYIGSVSAAGAQNTINIFPSGGPVDGRHTLLSSADAGTTDYYGDFPVLCPNGSGYSVKLGNSSAGTEAEGISYEFTIPANRNTYSLIYHYAVVFQDPNHQAYEQPRLVLEVTNVTDNQPINCSSFTFFPNGSPLPGFFQSTKSDSTAVWCKDWSAVTINLNGQAGKTIRLFFKTADCTFRRHFGYAYIDVNSECSSEFVGATYCPDDTAVNVMAPFGYQSYTWYNSTFTQILGSQQGINFTPPPPTGTTIAVEIIPYNGYGCQDTLYAKLIDTLTLTANAGANVLSCNKSPVSIGAAPKQGVVYRWAPATGLSNPNIANPKASPNVTTKYTLTVRSLGGGCMNMDEVEVTASIIDSALQIQGKTSFCITSNDSAVFSIQPVKSMQWYWDNRPISGAIAARYKANQSGTYYATLRNIDGCTINTRSEQVYIEIPKPGIVYPLQYAVKTFPLQLQARTFGTSVLWKPPMYLDKTIITNPVFTSPAEGDQEYTIDITTAAGCLTTDIQIVKTVKEVKIYVPTGFTPDNNGRNDYLRPSLIGVKELLYFRVYNRWGQLVYNMSPNHRGWDGLIGGLTQPTSVYVWMVGAIGLDNRTYTQKGTTTLIR